MQTQSSQSSTQKTCQHFIYTASIARDKTTTLIALTIAKQWRTTAN